MRYCFDVQLRSSSSRLRGATLLALSGVGPDGVGGVHPHFLLYYLRSDRVASPRFPIYMSAATSVKGQTRFHVVSHVYIRPHVYSYDNHVKLIWKNDFSHGIHSVEYTLKRVEAHATHMIKHIPIRQTK